VSDLNEDIHYFIVVGCGFLGAYLAGKLSEEENGVTVIDKNKSAFDKLPPYYGGYVLNRDVNDSGILLEAGIQKACAVISVTGNDVLNMFASTVAKDIYHVEHVFANLYDSRRADAYRALGVKTICASNLWLDAFKKEATL
jgi:trk system potassium uptake protein TrkA